MLFVRLFDLRLFGFVCFHFFSSCLGWAVACDCRLDFSLLGYSIIFHE